MVRAWRNILIVDDSPEDREMYRRYLLRDRDYTYNFWEATIGAQGLELWQQHQPDAVLLDYRLPDLDGVEFLARLKSSTQQPYLPVVMVTGQGNEAIAVQAMKAGAQDYLVKEQMTPEGLQLAVGGAIETVQLRIQLQQRIERERVVWQITQKIHQSLDLAEILQTTVTEVRQFLQTDRVLIFCLESDSWGKIVTESVGAQWNPLVSTSLHDPCLSQGYIEKFRQGLVTVKPDIDDGSIAPCHVELLAKLQVRANLVVPILSDNQLWGMLIAHHCAAPRQWQVLEIDLLKELATKVGIALRQAELYQQAQHELIERRRVEAELRESEERLRVALEASRMGTWDWNIQTGVITWSDNLEPLFGLAKGEFDGSFEMFAERLHPDDRDRVLATIDHAIATGEDYQIEFRVVYPNGKIRWALTQGKVFYDENGQPLRMAGIDIDITERKLSQQALQKSEERFRTSVENILDCLGIYSAIRNEQGEIIDFQVEYVNHAACLNNQMSYEQQIGRGLCELLPGHRESGLFDEYCQVVETGQALIKENLIYTDEYGQQRLTRAFDIRVAKFGDGFVATWRDITARIQTQEALRQNEQLLRLALAGAQAGSWDWEIQTGKIFWSFENFHLYGLDPAHGSIEYADWYNALHQDDRQRANAEVSQLIQERQPEYRSEYRIVHPQRGVRWLLALGRLIVNEQGEPLRLSGINLDITDRIQAQLSLQESEARLQLAYKATSSGLWDLDVTSNIAYVSQEYCHLFGLDPTTQTITYQQWLSYLPPDESDRVNGVISRAIEQQQEYYECEYPIHRPEGVRWLGSRAKVFYDGKGAVRILGIVQDITDRKTTEIALQRSEDRLRMALESAQMGAWDYNLMTGVLIWDDNCKRMWGLPADAETNYDVFLAGLHPEDRDRTHQTIQQAFNPQSGGAYEIEYRTIGITDGIERWIAAKGQAYFHSSGQPLRFIGTVLDITARKQAEIERDRLLEQEKAARAEAERANRIKDEFLAVLSHELRSPLNPILGWAKLLQHRKFDPKKTASALATIERNAYIQTQLIDDLLDVAKILRGKFTMDEAPVNLVFVIEAALDTVRTAAVARSILLHSVLPPIGQVSGDSARLQQIVWNLLSNAIKFTPPGGRVDIYLERVGNNAQIIVKDTGKGINPEFLPHIFESFRQEDASTTRKYGGLGLGLAIVRHLVEAHGGTIQADSQGEGQGATFTVRLPLLDTAAQEIPPDELTKEADLAGIKVLIVDDEQDARELLQVVLEQYGAQVLAVTCATQVLASLESFPPDILISDIGMPDMDGYALMQQVRSLPPEKGGQIKAIALSAYARVEDQQRSLAVGFQHHISKPVDLDKLVQTIFELASS